jgi:hypothetical protein
MIILVVDTEDFGKLCLDRVQIQPIAFGQVFSVPPCATPKVEVCALDLQCLSDRLQAGIVISQT